MIKMGTKVLLRPKLAFKFKGILLTGVFLSFLPAGYFLGHNLIKVDFFPAYQRLIHKGQKEAVPGVARQNREKLMQYFKDIYGKKILSGQHISRGLMEVEAIYAVTGKKPAMLGLDFMEYSPSRVERGTRGDASEKALQWWREGGIITFCWHWNAPMGLIDRGPDKYWYNGYYTKATTFDFAKGVNNPESREYQLLIRDIDVIAAELKKLQKEGVPVLWRPLHEASGGWFWWGSKGPKPYKKLWRLMYDRLTNYHRLDNLIWVWNGEDSDWYPGHNLVDIVGRDFYGAKRDYSPRKEEFRKVQRYAGKRKMVALTETGVVPDPDQLKKTRSKWLWFMVWSEGFVLKGEQPKYSEEYTEVGMLKMVYHHDYVITRDELPRFRLK